MSAVFFSAGKAIVSASDDNTLKVWNVESGSLVKTLEGHSEEVIGVDVSHDSTRILSVSFENTAKLWNASTGEIQHTVLDVAWGSCCAFSKQ